MKSVSRWSVRSVSALLATLLLAPLVSSAFTIERSLCLGDSGKDVVVLQKFLRALGFFPLPQDTGYYGPITQAAIVSLQHAAGITQSGCVDGRTREFLNFFLSGSYATATGDSLGGFDYIGFWNQYAPPGYSPGYGGGGGSGSSGSGGDSGGSGGGGAPPLPPEPT